MTYPGGKSQSGVYQTLINFMPPHKVYIEPFLGGGGILLAKRPADETIACELDRAVYEQWTGHEVPNLQIFPRDGIQFLAEFQFTGGEMVYLDPPYLLSTRASQRPRYNCEMTEADHRRLLSVIKGIDANVMISGYHSELYSRELSAWRVETFTAVTRSGRVATEYVWLNFPEPLELHDYRYLGNDFIERQQIKRQQERWRNRLLGMTSTRRYAMLAVINELRTTQER